MHNRATIQLFAYAPVTFRIGPDCSGQVLVMHDLLGVFLGRKARFVCNFMDGQTSIDAAITAYMTAVKGGSFRRWSIVLKLRFDSSRRKLNWRQRTASDGVVRH